jgi:hypothetical protein
MIASGQNVKRLVAFGASGPRRPAQAAALRRPEAGRTVFVKVVWEHRRSCTWPPAGPFSTGWSVLGRWDEKADPLIRSTLWSAKAIRAL